MTITAIATVAPVEEKQIKNVPRLVKLYFILGYYFFFFWGGGGLFVK